MKKILPMGLMLLALITAVVLIGCASAEARAVRSGDIEGIREYINSGGDVNAPQRGADGHHAGGGESKQNGNRRSADSRRRGPPGAAGSGTGDTTTTCYATRCTPAARGDRIGTSCAAAPAAHDTTAPLGRT